MFTSTPLEASTGPKVTLLASSNDPLGQIAACAKMYLGEVVHDLSTITDTERRFYLGEMQKTKLKMPLEAVSMHFMLDGVSRGFTHQLVRQRTAAYAQESMRFAVVEDNFTDRVILPPSLVGTATYEEWFQAAQSALRGDRIAAPDEEAHAYVDRYAPQADKWRFQWDAAMLTLQMSYGMMVNTGMPAEDARGLLPTNIATRVNYITNLRGLLDHAGNRLCTQAQFEWRLVFSQIAASLRAYGKNQTYQRVGELPSGELRGKYTFSSQWQFDAIADLLRPVCYQVGHCVMKADFDRKCKIRDRVDQFAKHNVPSSDWSHGDGVYGDGETGPFEIKSIKPAEWLADPGAAR